MEINMLLVDDEQDIRDSLMYLLELEGYNVYTGSNRVEDSTGIQVAKVLHKINKNIKFMFFSGYSDVSNFKNELGFSLCEVFLKPIDPGTFLEKVRNVVTKELLI